MRLFSPPDTYSFEQVREWYAKIQRNLFCACFGILFLVLPLVSNPSAYLKKWTVLSYLRWYSPILCFLAISIAMFLGSRLVRLGNVFLVCWPDALKMKTDGKKLDIAPITMPYMWPIFFPAFVLMVPDFSGFEERLFREGDYTVLEGCMFSLFFGVCHFAGGIKFGYSLAIAIPGLFFMLCYRMAGLECSTAHHCLYNLMILAVVLVGLIDRSVRSWARQRPAQECLSMSAECINPK